METKERDMPIGIQDFEKLRNGNYLYVDKTAYVHELARLDRPYFLGRPRRFGKSLFLTTLKAYFLGKKELFEGLYIAGVEKNWMEYPVIYIDLNQAAYKHLQNLNNVLNSILGEYEKMWEIVTDEPEYSLRFKNIIKTAYEKTGRRVVVLVDEYDKPLIGTMDDFNVHEDIRITLKGFYGVLKGMDAWLRFVFLTGVTKFSQVSVFSDLNMLIDISIDDEYAGICGISEKELLGNFQPEIHALAEKLELTDKEAFHRLKKHYDGYHFAKESDDMYNPFSVLNTFDKKNFANYWFKTGTPTFLVNMLKNIDFDLPKLENDIIVTADYIYDYRANNSDPIPVLYQSGYLTIKGYDRDTDLYTLGFPNEEVRHGFLKELLPAYSSKTLNDGSLSVIRMMQTLKKGDINGMMTMLQSFYASIPYDLPHKKQRDESYFHSLFYLIFSLMGQFVRTEVKSATGRADAIVETDDTVYVFEFKMDDKATTQQALEQINSNGYLIPYRADSRQVVKIGAVFNRKKGLLAGWDTK